MPSKKSPKTEPLPVRTLSQQKEDQSRPIFEAAIRPWMISAYVKQDFGIDAIVEITKAIVDSADQIVTGKRF